MTRSEFLQAVDVYEWQYLKAQTGAVADKAAALSQTVNRSPFLLTALRDLAEATAHLRTAARRYCRTIGRATETARALRGALGDSTLAFRDAAGVLELVRDVHVAKAVRWVVGAGSPLGVDPTIENALRALYEFDLEHVERIRAAVR